MLTGLVRITGVLMLAQSGQFDAHRRRPPVHHRESARDEAQRFAPVAHFAPPRAMREAGGRRRPVAIQQRDEQPAVDMPGHCTPAEA